MEELQADLTNYAETVHGYTNEQIKNPKMMETIKAAVKQEQKSLQKRASERNAMKPLLT